MVFKPKPSKNTVGESKHTRWIAPYVASSKSTPMYLEIRTAFNWYICSVLRNDMLFIKRARAHTHIIILANIPSYHTVFPFHQLLFIIFLANGKGLA